jgi:quercetin dioxygenase-like cupin family protein
MFGNHTWVNILVMQPCHLFLTVVKNNDDFSGRMEETPHLQKCEYIRQISCNFGEVLGRSRLMRLTGGSQVPIHVDAIYHWHRHVRTHIPIITNGQVIFHCGGQEVNMKAGEC